MYSELLIWPSTMAERELSASEARSLVSKACDAFPVDPLIFNRDSSGRTLNEVAEPAETGGVPIVAAPRVCFGGGRGFLRLTGLGRSGKTVLAENAQLIGTAIGNLFESPWRFKFNEGQCTIAWSPMATMYYLPALVLTKRGNVVDRYSKDERSSLEQLIPLIKSTIVSGLIGEARMLDEDDGGGREAAIPSDEMLHLTVLSGKPMWLRINDRAHALMVTNLVVSMDLDLSGPWYTGKLRSRGYGRVFRHDSTRHAMKGQR